jgi:REP element-mobilizing transposase RayT
MWYGSRAIDKYSGTSYEHRRAWVEEKVLWLSSVFSIGICAYAVMSNHVHLVLCVDKDEVDFYYSEKPLRISASDVRVYVSKGLRI